MAVERDRPADQIWIATQSIPPQVVADHRHRMRARRAVFLRQKRAAQEGLYAEGLEVIPGHNLAEHQFAAVSVAAITRVSSVVEAASRAFIHFSWRS